VQRALHFAVLSAVAFAAALGLGGCNRSIDPPDAAPVTLTPITTQAPSEAAVPTGPLPPPAALIDVMVRITDPGVPGTDKVGLIQYSTPEDPGALDRFDKAVSDSGFRPLSFEANDLKWSNDIPGNVAASFIIRTHNPKYSEFNFPLEFSPVDGTWQLTRQTADMLLDFGNDSPSASPTASPSPSAATPASPPPLPEGPQAPPP
jgi:hypothetical protein